MSKLDTVSPKLDSQLADRIRQPRLAPPPAPAGEDGCASGASAAGAGAGERSLPDRLRECGYLIFDCDGVLVDSESMSCAALHQAVLEVTGKQHGRGSLKTLLGVWVLIAG
jgi:hypothetical protein